MKDRRDAGGRHDSEEFPQTFLPRRIGRAADREMEAVLAEDEAMRKLAADLGIRL